MIDGVGFTNSLGRVVAGLVEVPSWVQVRLVCHIRWGYRPVRQIGGFGNFSSALDVRGGAFKLLQITLRPYLSFRMRSRWGN